MRKKSRLGQSLELAAMSVGFKHIAGVDEAGRGPLAGPVVAAAVILDKKAVYLGVDDSKKLSAKKRESLYGKIIENCVSYNIYTMGVVGVDSLNIFWASMHAMKLAIEGMSLTPDFVYVDGNKLPDIKIAAQALVGGDRICMSVAAASILAKVCRDRQMVEYDELYPGYGFAKHKGYGTKEHLEALERLGPSPIHRRSFAPVKKYLEP